MSLVATSSAPSAAPLWPRVSKTSTTLHNSDLEASHTTTPLTVVAVHSLSMTTEGQDGVTQPGQTSPRENAAHVVNHTDSSNAASFSAQASSAAALTMADSAATATVTATVTVTATTTAASSTSTTSAPASNIATATSITSGSVRASATPSERDFSETASVSSNYPFAPRDTVSDMLVVDTAGFLKHCSLEMLAQRIITTHAVRSDLEEK